MAKKIDKAWVVIGMNGYVLCDDHGKPQEFKTYALASKRAKKHVLETDDSEAWVFTMTHLFSRPAEVNVERVG